MRTPVKLPGHASMISENCCTLCCRYYLNGADAFRLKLLLPLPEEKASALAAQQLAGMHMGAKRPCTALSIVLCQKCAGT